MKCIVCGGQRVNKVFCNPCRKSWKRNYDTHGGEWYDQNRVIRWAIRRARAAKRRG